MMSSNNPPSFWETYVRSVDRSRKDGDIFLYFPFWYIVFCIAFPISIVYRTNIDFSHLDRDWTVLIATSSMVISGVLGAFAISAAMQISSLTSEYPFSDFLIENDLLDEFLFHPQYVITIQLGTLCYALFIIVVSFVSRHDILLTLSISLCFACAIMCYRTWSLISLMRQIVWYYAHYMKMYKEDDFGNEDAVTPEI